MNTCEICGQRVEPNDPKSTTRYYIPWCENRIKELEGELEIAKQVLQMVKDTHIKNRDE